MRTDHIWLVHDSLVKIACVGVKCSEHGLGIEMCTECSRKYPTITT